MNLAGILSVMKRNRYLVYDQPYRVNIVGLRSNQTTANRFDDEIHVFFKTDSKNWQQHIFKATTDPGTYWLQNPSSPQGTAILAQGQYKNAYQIGMHQGKYKALVQRAPVTVMRDYDRNALLDFFNGTPATGLFGINIHRASVNGTTKYVDKYSAGCQVFANSSDFETFLQLCEKHSSLYGNSFTYTLIDFRAVHRERMRGIATLSGIAALGITGLLVAEHYYMN